MSVIRGVGPFEGSWSRRTTLEDDDGLRIELMALPDLVQAKKTQRDKDWPMIRRLVEVHYANHRAEPTPERIEFWLREGRSPSLLVEVARMSPAAGTALLPARPLLAHAVEPDLVQLAAALALEEQRERDIDRLYWEPLRKEMEQLRHQRIKEPQAQMDTQTTAGDSESARSLNFIEEIIEEHNRTGRFGALVHTPFPPEPDGYFHNRHAKSIFLNYGLAVKDGGQIKPPHDGTQPVKG